MIPTYNCADYLRQTLQSVLDQDLGPERMQIEVIDDCSTKDDPETVVREVGGGRVAFFRQPVNRGLTNNFNTCVRRATGELIHILHGDDLVYAGFYQAIEAASRAEPGVGLYATRTFIIDDLSSIETIGPRLSGLERASREVAAYYYSNPFFPAAVVIRRSAYEAHGGYHTGLSHTADWEMYVRAIHASGGLAINQPLAGYRRLARSHSGRLVRSGDNLREWLKTGEVFQTLPGFSWIHMRASVAGMAIFQMRSFAERGDAEAAQNNRLVWQATSTPLHRLRVKFEDFIGRVRRRR